jgi:hypothetical protein
MCSVEVYGGAVATPKWNIVWHNLSYVRASEVGPRSPRIQVFFGRMSLRTSPHPAGRPAATNVLGD